MTFFDVFLLFSLYTIGLYHVVLGVTGLLSGAAVVFPMPYAPYRPTPYLLVAGIIGFPWVMKIAGPEVTYSLFAILVTDLIVSTLRPVFRPSVQIVGAGPSEINQDVVNAFGRMQLRYTGTYPSYKILEPYARLSIRYHKGLGVGELCISPASRKPLLERISDLVAKQLDGTETKAPQKVYLFLVAIGALLLLAAFIRVGTLIA